MAECAYCKSETELYQRGTSICLECAAKNSQAKFPDDGDEVRAALQNEVIAAASRLQKASARFTEVIDSIPSRLPHPGGIERILNASGELAAARKAMMTAHSRWDDFVSRGVIPARPPKAGSGAL